MAIEQKWPTVAPQLFTANGTALGQVQIADTRGFKVKQKVVIVATGQPTIQVQVKRVVSPSALIVGPLAVKQGESLLTVRSDISAYTTASGAFIYAEEQEKSKLKPDDIIQAVYRQEPGTTIGVELDDEFGAPFGPLNPLPTSPVPLWDEIDLTYNVQQDLDTATFKKGAISTVLTFFYDAFANLTKVMRS